MCSSGAHSSEKIINQENGSSSDMTLKQSKGKSKCCTKTFQGYTDTVGGVAIKPNLGILTAYCDGTISLWAFSGELLLEMVGHTSIVSSVDVHSSGVIVTGSEDCSAKIWKDGICVQSIGHPGCVRGAKFLENGDIVTACSDGIVRIWTIDHERAADTAELHSFASQISKYKLSCSRMIVEGLKVEDLPGLDALMIPGSSDGQTKVVREGDNGMAYAWNMSERKRDKIGEVVDGPDVNMKPSMLNGVQGGDYVIDVDTGDGEPIRILPYNHSASGSYSSEQTYEEYVMTMLEGGFNNKEISEYRKCCANTLNTKDFYAPARQQYESLFRCKGHTYTTTREFFDASITFVHRQALQTRETLQSFLNRADEKLGRSDAWKKLSAAFFITATAASAALAAATANAKPPVVAAFASAACILFAALGKRMHSFLNKKKNALKKHKDITSGKIEINETNIEHLAEIKVSVNTTPAK